jgi:molecular chaperone Hsp33
MTDYILRVTAADNRVRAFFATTRQTVGTAAKIHQTTPTATAALGRLLTAGIIMGYTLKNDRDLLTLSIKGDGPIGGLLVTADNKGNVKGYPHNPTADLPLKDGKLDVSGAVGNGTLTVVKDMGLKEPYSGKIELVSGEIAMDIAYYYATSEQTPGVVSLGVLIDTDHTVKQAGGFLIQLMPDAPDEIIDELERTTNIPNITALLDSGITPEALAQQTLGNLNLQIHEKLPCRYRCTCSKEKAAAILKSLSENDRTEVVCHFCNTVYNTK